MSLRGFGKELGGKRVEGELVKTICYSLLTSAVVLGLLYFFRFRFMSDFNTRYGLVLFLAVLTYALLVSCIRHVRAYRELPCMTGMMVGMTLGMIGGFLPGLLVGATNGMFVGSLFGMGVGILIGVWTGSCCGVMGVMEGMMAGLMGGLMGAMTAVMTFNDHLSALLIVVWCVGAIILIGLQYLVYHEMRDSEAQRNEEYLITSILTFVLLIVTVAVMVYGPRSFLFS